MTTNFQQQNSNLRPNNSYKDFGKCCYCTVNFTQSDEVIQVNAEQWHKNCFVCAQCFCPFEDGVFFEYESRRYCQHDFQMLFAPCCGLCEEFIIGRVIKAMGKNWHPNCFKCVLCSKVLSDEGFVKSLGRALCHECNSREKADKSGGHYVCAKCHGPVMAGSQLRWRGDVYHAYHFHCRECGQELGSGAREREGGELLCLGCHDRVGGVPICGACRRPIEERVVRAMGKAWHVEHFVCAQCEKPFLGSKHYERRGLAYCAFHHQTLFGALCFTCKQLTGPATVEAVNKAWCEAHFACAACDTRLTPTSTFYEMDLRPLCKKCYARLPLDLRKRLAKTHKAT